MTKARCLRMPRYNHSACCTRGRHNFRPNVCRVRFSTNHRRGRTSRFSQPGKLGDSSFVQKCGGSVCSVVVLVTSSKSGTRSPLLNGCLGPARLAVTKFSQRTEYLTKRRDKNQSAREKHKAVSLFLSSVDQYFLFLQLESVEVEQGGEDGA